MVSAPSISCKTTCLKARRLLDADMNSYDPDFEDWQLGKLSALREIALALEVKYRYYYMGKRCGSANHGCLADFFQVTTYTPVSR